MTANQPERTTSLPVIGGTGLYTGASGTVVMTITDPAQPVLAFDFTTE